MKTLKARRMKVEQRGKEKIQTNNRRREWKKERKKEKKGNNEGRKEQRDYLCIGAHV